jgi:hypothetical protein
MSFPLITSLRQGSVWQARIGYFGIRGANYAGYRGATVSQFGIDGTTRALQPDALLKPALCHHRIPREGAALDHRLLAIATA